MPTAPHHLHLYWENAGPYSSDANALTYLRRYNFIIEKGVISPPRGYELNSEDLSAIEYLVKEWDYAYFDNSDMPVKPRPGESKQ